jgi:hypothetical protein
MHAHAIPQVEPPSIGVHLVWMGPHVWVYSLAGWSVQRREFSRREERQLCDELNSAAIAKLRIERERQSPLGAITLRDGVWPIPIAGSAEPPTPCDVFGVDLDQPRRRIRITVKARHAFAVGLRDGKVVAVDGPRSGGATFDLHAITIDTIAFYSIAPGSVRICVGLPVDDEERDWSDVPFIVKNLQIPVQPLMPALDSPAKEFAEGKNRLLAGETLDEDEFARLTNSLRPGVRQAGPPRPIDQVLLIREDQSGDFEEVIALDPIRVLLSHPKWRRVLGFGWFDDDPALEVGKTYEYRITGTFPAEDVTDVVYGFHTIPSQALLPAEFLLHDLRLRLPEPTAVDRAPGTPDTGAIQISRRGIQLRPRENPFWVSIPSLQDNSLVIDFPSAVTSVILELHADHALTFTAHGFGGLGTGVGAVPAGERPRLNFPFPARQIRLQGKGFLFAIRVPSGTQGLQPRSIVLPPVVLQNTPRPQPPVLATLRNLQQAAAPPGQDDTPPATPSTRPALGFEVTWRPALREGVAIWPPDADAAPPLDAALFQIEHREETLQPMMASLADDAPAPSTGSARTAPRLSAARLAAIAQASLPDDRRGALALALAAGDVSTANSLLFTALSDWKPVLRDENWTVGDRAGSTSTAQIRIHPGVNVMSVFPELPRPGTGLSLDLLWADVFDFEEGGTTVQRPVPAPGTYHRYRVRSVDPIGRPSLAWTETDVLRLEKRIPPPVPPGPDETPADTLTLPRPSGVQAKAIVKNAPGLTSDDLAVLGSDDNVIVLRWGWHAGQREEDPFATEFRVYATDKPLDVIAGVLVSATAASLGVYEVVIQLERPVVADAAKDAPLDAGYPFVVYAHGAGQTITATIGTRVPAADGSLHEPSLGPVRLSTHFTPDLTRPPAWTSRIEVQPITAATEYRAVFRNRLTLTPDHPRDAIWVGVSTADAQSYVADQLDPVESRPGNESAIVPVVCEARFHGRPDFSIPPPLDPVPVMVTAEPTDRAIEFDLDLTAHLGAAGLTPGQRIRPERVSAAAVFAAYAATPGGQIVAKAIDPRSASETDREVTVPNPSDRSAILAALNGTSLDALDDRFVVFLAGSHPYADRLFEPVTRQAVPFGALRESLPPTGERYVYRARLSDAAGHLSAGAAMAAVIVRVPSMTRPPIPVQVRRAADDAAGLLRVRVGPGAFASHVLVFHRVVSSPDPAGGEAVVVRIPNLPDLYPAGGIRVRTRDGALIAPAVKALSDADVVVDGDDFRNVQLTIGGSPGERLQVWACSVSRDGVPSILAGPWGLAMPPAPLPVPALAATRAGSQVVFAWTWPAGDREGLEVALERSVDGIVWHRFSKVLGGEQVSYIYTLRAAANQQYRIAVMTAGGRSAFGEPITAV